MNTNRLDGLKNKLKEKEANIEREKSKIIEENKKRKRKGTFIYVAGRLLLVVGVVSIVAFLVLFVRKLFTGKDIDLVPGFVILAGAIGGIAAGAHLISEFERPGEKPLPNRDKEIEIINKEIERVERLSLDSAIFTRQIPVLESTNIELLDKNALNYKCLEDYKKEYSDKIKLYSFIANETYNALVKEHSDLLDVRDWKNLDLVIYYLETKRAISVREALQLVDRQHQTEAIMDTLNMATKQISETIKMGFAGMENTVLKCASVLSSQLSDVSVKLSSIELSQDLTNKYLGKISSNIAISNSLREKANVTSAKLMEDVRQMRIYADNAQVRMRNS